MKNVIFAIAATLAVAGCTATERGAVTGGAIGAAAGAIVADDDLEGAIVGGAIGAVAGAVIGRASEPGFCVYEDNRGRRYRDRCPAGY